MKDGNDAPVYADGALDASATMMTDDASFALPKTVPVVYSDNAKKDAAVQWEAFDLAAARAKGNADYTIAGKAEGYDVVCNLAVREFNFVENDSFEEPTADPWVLSVNAGTLSNTHKIGVTAENPKSGKNAYHFWTSDAAGVDFDLTQTLSLRTSGTYKLSFSVLGGGLGTAAVTASKEDVYGYVLLDGEETARVPVTVTSYSDGYRTYRLDDIRYEAGETLTVGIHIGIAEANCWGDIDDVMFNYVGE